MSRTRKTAAGRGAKSRKRTTPGRKPRKPKVQKYILRLFVAGQTPRSLRSIENLRLLCDKHLRGRFVLEVVDIYQQPALASEGQIIAAPTLVKSMPLPLRRLVGDFTDQKRVILGLDLLTS